MGSLVRINTLERTVVMSVGPSPQTVWVPNLRHTNGEGFLLGTNPQTLTFILGRSLLSLVPRPRSRTPTSVFTFFGV